ncbi:hypothetical protein L218DRAFT_990659 [Marasmius fiardii PR-910]|nr:hypothetical protein L218DRAFT_990659 [Marasmius fiardii PR-910]
MKPQQPRRFPPEVIRNVFENLKLKGELPLSVALVTKDWFGWWVASRWRTITDCHQVLVMLTGGEVQKMVEPTDKAWDRFKSIYAPHVRDVILQPKSRYNCLKNNVAREIYLNRLLRLLVDRYPSTSYSGESGQTTTTTTTTEKIFPNLQTIVLAWLTCANPLTLDRLVQLGFRMAHDGVTQMQIVDSAANLEKHGMKFGYENQGVSAYGDGTVEVHMSGFALYGPKEMKRLVKLIFETWVKTSALSLCLPEVKGMFEEMKGVSRWGKMLGPRGVRRIVITHAIGNTLDLDPMWRYIPVLEHHPSLLVDVDLVLDLVGSAQFFEDMSSWGPARRLRKMSLLLRYIGETPDGVREAKAIRKLFKHIAKFGPNLRDLYVSIDSEPMSNALGSTKLIETRRPIHFSTLVRLQGCTKLRHLTIRDRYPIVMDEEEFKRLIVPWKKIKSITFSASTKDAARNWVEILKEWRQLGSIKFLDSGIKRRVYLTLWRDIWTNEQDAA